MQMRKKRPLTLLEVIIATILLGILLAGLFNIFRQGIKKSIAARDLKQQILQLELFQQKMKNLFTQEKGVWIEQHLEAQGNALFIAFEQKTDSDFEMCGDLQGMLFLNAKKELCFASWSEKASLRVETLLDKVDGFTCRLFEAKKGEWASSWPPKKAERPVMASIDLIWNEKQIPFVFFLASCNEKISYSGPP
jgi:type II secretory pathway pseudopilin PulG